MKQGKIRPAAAPTNGLVFVSNAGDCTTAYPCSLGTLAAGTTRTTTTTYSVPASYTTPTPTLNTKTDALLPADNAFRWEELPDSRGVCQVKLDVPDNLVPQESLAVGATVTDMFGTIAVERAKGAP